MRVLGLLLVAGCGRVGFEDAARTATDAAVDVACGAVETSTRACDPPQTGTLDEMRMFDCANGGWTAPIVTSNNCICMTGSDQQTIQCMSGMLIQQRDFTCPAATWGSWYDVMNTCTGTIWVPTTPPDGPYGVALTINAGDACGAPGNMMPCSAPSGAGTYWHYATCQCE